MSKSKITDTHQDDPFHQSLSVQLNPRRPLFILAGQIDWQELEDEFTLLYQGKLGYSPLLQHMEGLSEKQVTFKWVKNPYF